VGYDTQGSGRTGIGYVTGSTGEGVGVGYTGPVYKTLTIWGEAFGTRRKEDFPVDGPGEVDDDAGEG